MGGGSWTKDAYCSYTVSTRGVDVDFFKTMDCTAQQMYKSRSLDKALNPYNVMRECCDSKEHPNTKPVILALDVTGSMGHTAVDIAQKLSDIIEECFSMYSDIEFLTMGIGDLAYDYAPIQASQFESDIRIAEQMDKIYFESGGGGNSFESYTAAWYFGIHNCKLDCWNRGEKGLIITMGDEPCNPYLPHTPLNKALGSTEQSDVETKNLVQEVTKKYDVYHICTRGYDHLAASYRQYLPADRVIVSEDDKIKDVIMKIIADKYGAVHTTASSEVKTNDNGELVW